MPSAVTSADVGAAPEPGNETGLRTTWEALQADLRRYVRPEWSRWRRWRCLLQTEEVWVLALYRAGSWIYGGCPWPLSSICKLVWKPMNGVVSTLLDTHLSVGARIGPGLYLGHHGGVWVNPAARLGAFCNIGQGVIIGAAGMNDRPSAPVLGDRVWVGPHAIITGSARVGSGSVIGANSLVVADVPERGLVVGVPARLMGHTGSERLIRLERALWSRSAPTDSGRWQSWPSFAALLRRASRPRP